MADKALISEFTWRSLEMQKAAFPDMAHYILPDDELFILRKTQRKEMDVFHVMSLAIIADNEKDFRSFVGQIWKLGASIKSQDGELLHPSSKMKNSVAIWREFRKKGTAKIGVLKYLLTGKRKELSKPVHSSLTDGRCRLMNTPPKICWMRLTYPSTL